MFKLELLDLLKQYSKADEYEQKKILTSIKKLLEQHTEEFETFVNEAGLNSKQLAIIQEAKNNSPIEDNEHESDIDKVKKIYDRWREEYLSHHRNVTSGNEDLVINLIKFYAPNRSHIIEKLLSINDDEDYTAFKNMLMNYLRIYYSEKFSEYRKTSKYENLEEKEYRQVVKKMKQIYNKMDKYEFDFKLIDEVLA